MGPLVLIVLCGLAAAQVTRLYRDDAITESLRGWLDRHLDPTDRPGARLAGLRYWLLDLLDCPWCLSGWFAVAAVVIADWFYPVPLPGLVWLASWRVAVLAYWLVEVLADHDARIVADEPARVRLSGEVRQP